jgi:tRNA dimethylallyltransferase
VIGRFEPSAEIIAIVGPTASGKSTLADALAVRLGGEVVSADSMQVYRGMDVGTAKTPEPERSVPYHCIDLVDPGQSFTAALYQRYARIAIDEISSYRRRVIFCGGTGLYLRAALDHFALDEGREQPTDRELRKQPTDSELREQPADSELREQLKARAESLGPEAFHAELAKLDPESAVRIHPNNVRRVIRAFELLEQGSGYARATADFHRFESVYPVRFIGLHIERELLYQLIDTRVDTMIKDGWLGEVQVLLSEDFGDALKSSQAIGYKEMVQVLEGKMTLREASEATKQATRRYAKRQLTWFNRDPRIEWIDITELHRRMLNGVINSEDFRFMLLSSAMQLLNSTPAVL